MQLAIHQPEFMPWLGFFHKMALADLYVVFDHVQFKKRYFENRNRIVSPRGEVSYIVTPVKSKGKYTQSICDVEIDNTQYWQNKILKKVEHFYCTAPYFEHYYENFRSTLLRPYDRLIELNMALINFFRMQLNIHTPMVYSSSMNVTTYTGSDLILQICLQQKADVYLCGASGRDYLKLENFTKNGVDIRWLDYKSPVYPQLCQGFVPNLSTVDLLFNHGERSLKILMHMS